jgi:Tfp pilus assembly protein FimT
MMITLATSAVVLGIVSRPAATYLNRSRTGRAAAVVAGDLDLARSMAMRQRQPVRLSFSVATSQYTLATRSGSTVYKTIALGTASDFHLPTISFSPATVDFYPNGVASSALTVTLTAGSATRRVTLTRVGMIRTP